MLGINYLSSTTPPIVREWKTTLFSYNTLFKVMPSENKLVSTGAFEGFTFANNALSFFAPSTSLIGQSARDIRNSNEVAVSEGAVFTFTLEPRKAGGNLLVTPHGIVSAKAGGRVRGFILAGNVFTEENDDKKATHQFWVADEDLRTVTVLDERTNKSNTYITAKASV